MSANTLGSHTASRIALGIIAGGVVALVQLGAVLPAPQAQAASPSDSAKTVTAASYDPDAQDSPFPDLKVTVSQTKDLIQQGLTVSWTGGKPSTVPNQQTGGSNFLQIAQCWGDEPSSGGTRPDRTTCQYGGLATPGDSRSSTRDDSETIAKEDASYTAVSTNWTDPTTTGIPFASATGETVASIVDGKKVPHAPSLNNNQFFNKYTTNEVSWAGSGSDGSGSVSFEVQTVQQSPGLGCGTPQKVNGTVTGTSCWLVVIPRGMADPGRSAIVQSGLLWDTWKHHVAIRLDFKPAGLQCTIGAAERQLSGSELAAGAIGQWQPKMCNTSKGAIYSLLTGPESDAAEAANGTGTAPLALTSRALEASSGTDKLVYAPIAITAVSIGFSIDRYTGSKEAPPEVKAKERQAFRSLKLTPRLLAKLLTASYTDALPLGANRSHVSTVRNLTADPEFLAINDPEWANMSLTGPGIGDSLVPLGRSDAAFAVWSYIVADPSARDFLNGVPDKWGMHVNPYYSTNPRVNPTGVGLTLPRDDFPKADPIEFPGYAKNGNLDAVNLVTWRPYTASLDATANAVLRGDDQELGEWDPTSVPPKYGKAARDLVGLQRVIGITDTASGDRNQIAQAALLNPAGRYVTATDSTLLAAASAMTPDSAQSQVKGFDATSAAAASATSAYPLTMPVYAAANPKMKGAAVRADYAAFIRYAAGAGQVRGTDDGELPDGYAALPASWQKQARTAATAIENGETSASGGSSTGGVKTKTPTPTPSSPAGSIPSGTAPGASGSASAKPTDSANPSGSGSSSGSLSGKTPDDPNPGPAAAIVPTALGLGLTAAIGIPLSTRLRRRRL